MAAGRGWGGGNSYTQFGTLKRETSSFITVTKIHNAFLSNHIFTQKYLSMIQH